MKNRKDSNGIWSLCNYYSVYDDYNYDYDVVVDDYDDDDDDSNDDTQTLFLQRI